MKNIQRGKVILKSVATWIVAIVAVLNQALQELNKVAGAPEWLVHSIATAVTILGGALVIIYRVTPVEKDQRGILPNE